MLARVGGGLLVVGGLATAAVVAVALSGGTIGLPERYSPPPSGGELLTVAAVTLFGLGALALVLARADPLHARVARAGLALAGIAAISQAIGTVLSSYLTVQQWPLLFFLGFFVVGIPGVLLLGLSLALGSGWRRVVGACLLLGLIGLGVGTAVPAIAGPVVLLIPTALTVIGVRALWVDNPAITTP